MLEQSLAVAAPDRAGQLRQIFLEGAEHFQHAVLVGEEHVAPHRRIGRRDAGEIAEAAGGEFQHFRAGDVLELVGGADDRIGDQMRQMAGDGQHEVMPLGVHDLDIGAERAPELHEFFHRGRIGTVRRRQDAPAIAEQFGEAGIRPGILGAGDGMAGDEVHVIRQMRGHRLQHRRLHRTDVGDDRPLHQMRPDALRDRAGHADRHAGDHQIGVLDRAGIVVRDAVGEIDLDRTRPHRSGRIGRHQLAGQTKLLDAARQRGADQSKPDQRDAPERRPSSHFVSGVLAVMKARSVSMKKRLASSVPIVMRSAFGRP